ncbi:hypothetical protein [Streptomyces sp. NPDC088752]|uniref:hypothetical protein n=1 Tax=Streptomyces sp. NPDC088752 TaxID=3154963 RepID=UPI003439C8C3
MVTSKSRRNRYQKEKTPQPEKQEAAPAPVPPPAAAAAAAPSEPEAEIRARAKRITAMKMKEIDFTLPPGALLQAQGSPPLATKPKTVRVPGALNVHVAGFQARHGTRRYSFDKASRALWRVLLREEHLALEQARVVADATGRPVEPKMGPLFTAVRDELEKMRSETADEDF